MSEFAIPSIGIATAASAPSITSGETPLRSAPKTKVAGKTGASCSGRTPAVDCSATIVQAPRALASATAWLACGARSTAPSTVCLARLARACVFVSPLWCRRSPGLQQERITEPEDGADVVILAGAVQNNSDWSARSPQEFVAGQLVAAQLRRCQRPAHLRAVSGWHESATSNIVVKPGIGPFFVVELFNCFDHRSLRDLSLGKRVVDYL